MKFYTNAFVNKNKIFVRGIDEAGAQVKRVYDYSPYLFVKCEEETGYKTINGGNVARMDFANIWESRDFIKQYKDVAGFPIYGLTDFAYTFLNDYFPGNVSFESSNISVVSFDIENLIGTEDIATSLITTPNEVTAVTLSKDGIKYAIHTCDFVPNDDKVISYRMANEKELLEKFIELWKKLNPDAITGWNIEFYDIPYIVGRIRRILGEDAVSQLSPWGIVRPYEIEIQGRTLTSYEFKGIATLDYLQLYKKFTYVTRESYKLDHIAEVELNEKKLDYSEYKNLNDLYYKNPQLYMEYNIHDVVLIDRLEDKLKLIELVFAIAYDAKVNYTDTLASVKQWDVIIHNYLMDRKIVVPPVKESMASNFEGAYVKVPQVGMHDWVVSFDLNSLYPHLIQHYNISPEKYVGRESNFPSVDQLLEMNFVPPDTRYSYAANGCKYLRDSMGFLGEIMAKMYDDRNYYKGLLKEQKKIFQETKSEESEKLVSKYDNAQMAKKIQLNSAYGAIGNRYFRWFDLNHAEAITISGQFAIRWIADKLNIYLNKLCKSKDVDFIIASDTDSVYIRMGELVKLAYTGENDPIKITAWLDKVCRMKIEKFIDESYQEMSTYMNSFAQKMIMKREAIADKAIWTAKKRYILNVWDLEGLAYTEPKLKISGIEAVKSSTPLSCRSAIKEALKIIMNGSEDKVQKYVKDFKNEFYGLDFEKIAFPRSVNNLSTYDDGRGGYVKKTPVNAKGSLLYNRLIKEKGLETTYETIASGDKIKFCYLKIPNPFRYEVIACPSVLPKEFGADVYIDYDTQFEKAFLKPLNSILKPIGWEAEKSSSLMMFFRD